MEDGLQLSGVHNTKKQSCKVLALVAVCRNLTAEVHSSSSITHDAVVSDRFLTR